MQEVPLTRAPIPVQNRLLTRPGLHTTAFYVALFMANGVQLPFWPLWLERWGLAPAEVGLYTALGMGVRVVAGMAVPALADRFDARRATAAVAALIAAAVFLAHLGISTRPALLAATVAAGAAMAGTGPLAEALGTAAARVWRFPYAQARGVGSLGFLLANLVVGALIARTGPGIALWWIVGCMLVVALLAPGHPGGGHVATGAPPSLREIGRLMLNPVFLVFAGLVGLLQASHAVFYALGTLHWQALGIGSGEIGALWATGVAGEIVFMVFMGTTVVQTLGPIRSMALAGLAAVVRWAAMMADPTGFWLWPIQALHALTFGLGHLGAMAFISMAVPDRYAAAAQGATGAVAVGGLLALGMALASAVYPRLGGGTYGIGVLMALAAILLAGLLARSWSGGTLEVPPASTDAGS